MLGYFCSKLSISLSLHTVYTYNNEVTHEMHVTDIVACNSLMHKQIKGQTGEISSSVPKCKCMYRLQFHTLCAGFVLY